MKDFAPKRRLINSLKTEAGEELSAWVYAESNEQTLFIKARVAAKFNLADYDSWLIELGPCEARDELIERRQSAVEAKNIQELRHHLEFLHIVCTHIRRDEYLVPLAIVGRKHNARLQREVLKQIMKILRDSKKNGNSLKDFLRSAANGSVEKLLVIDIPGKSSTDESYEFIVETEYGDEVSLIRARSTLDNWWADCDQ